MNVYLPGNITDMQGPCAEGFHVPSKTEWEGLATIMTSFGYTDGTEYKSKLHMPYSGSLDVGTGNQYYVGTNGYYWSCKWTAEANSSYFVIRDIYNSLTGNTRPGRGYSIRPFKDGFITPDNTWTVVQGTLGSAGIFRDTVNGLISITGDGTIGYTISDKNLGATTVYNSGDAMSEANCGKFYQRGNNYGFSFTGATTTSSSQVDASSYGPGNYYSSSTFITGARYSWDSSNNKNLRGGETGIINELKNAYIGEYKGWKPGDNTLFYYNIDDNDTASILYDKTGNLNMTWNAAPTYSIDSKVGRYVHGFSTSVFAKASKYVNFGTEYTMSCLVYFDSSWTWGVLFSQGESSSFVPDKTLEFGDGAVFFRTTRGNPASVYTEANPGVNKWSVYTFVCSQTGNYRKIYVNGVEIATDTYLNTTTLDGAYPSIGVWSQRNIIAPMLGYMKNLLGENKAWTAQEVLDYYNQTKSTYGL